MNIHEKGVCKHEHNTQYLVGSNTFLFDIAIALILLRVAALVHYDKNDRNNTKS